MVGPSKMHAVGPLVTTTAEPLVPAPEAVIPTDPPVSVSATIDTAPTPPVLTSLVSVFRVVPGLPLFCREKQVGIPPAVVVSGQLLMVGVISDALVRVLLVSVSVVFLPTSVSAVFGRCKVTLPVGGGRSSVV